MLTDPITFVEWYHSKFRHTYHPMAFPEMVHDHRVLITLIKQFDCRTICEIGTWNGDTALLMWLYPLVKRVKCIDIHEGMSTKFDQANHALRAKEEYGKMVKNTFVELEFADTMKMDKSGTQQHDLVFIDACHEYDNVLNDFHLALSFSPKVIALHDYHNGNVGVDKAVDELIAINKMEFMQFKNSCIVAKTF